MIVAIFLILLAINFNVGSSNPHGTPASAKALNTTGVLFQWMAIVYAVCSLIYGLLKT